MLPQKSLHIVLNFFKLPKPTLYVMSKLMDMDRGNLGKMTRSTSNNIGWDRVKAVADGLEQVHPVWKAVFYALLPLDEDDFEGLDYRQDNHPEPQELLQAFVDGLDKIEGIPFQQRLLIEGMMLSEYRKITGADSVTLSPTSVQTEKRDPRCGDPSVHQ